MKKTPKHPMQPLLRDEHKTVRFKKNALVTYLLDNGGLDMNHLAVVPGISQDDRTQFAQLIGYSLGGFHELSYVTDTVALKASAAARKAGLGKKVGGCRDTGCPIHCGVKEEK